MKVLLHSCCAPCSVQCVQALAEEGIGTDIFWYNPNIHPYTEYRARRDSLQAYTEDRLLRLIIEDEYGLRGFLGAVGTGELPQRCAFCYRVRLEKTAGRAAEGGYDAFSAALLISPYQDHDLIRKMGEELAARYGVQFLYRDFRPLFRAGQQQAREAAYYMQKYCGCIFSEEERYLAQGKK